MITFNDGDLRIEPLGGDVFVSYSYGADAGISERLTKDKAKQIVELLTATFDLQEVVDTSKEGK